MNRYLIGVDIGTQGTKTCLYDVENQYIGYAGIYKQLFIALQDTYAKLEYMDR